MILSLLQIPELRHICRFFTRQAPRYIFMVIQNQQDRHEYISAILRELKKSDIVVEYLELMHEGVPVYTQIQKFVEDKKPGGLLIGSLGRLLRESKGDNLRSLNISRDALRRFKIPIGFLMTAEDIAFISANAPDLYQKRDRSDFVFPDLEVSGIAQWREVVSYVSYSSASIEFSDKIYRGYRDFRISSMPQGESRRLHPSKGATDQK